MHLRICVRPSLRLRDFDYASPGAYFVTITINERASLLGSLNRTTGGVELNDAGKMVERWWLKLPQKFESVTLDAHAIMPDHFHGIVLLESSDEEPRTSGVPLPKLIQWFKTMTTAEYFRGVQNQSWRRVNGRVWQRGFYDHVIRTERDLLDIRTYIEGNPGALFEQDAGRTHGSAPTTSG
jgi:putative transposase